MPTVLRLGSYRLYFYSHEPNEPPHVHVDRDEASLKAWLAPVTLAGNRARDQCYIGHGRGVARTARGGVA